MFKPGDPRPTGYIAFCEWIEAHVEAGIERTLCPNCRHWNFPQEFSSTSIEVEVSPGKAVNTIVCQRCADTITT